MVILSQISIILIGAETILKKSRNIFFIIFRSAEHPNIVLYNFKNSNKNRRNYMKQCKHCLQKKPLSEFYKDKSKSDGYRYICKACTKIQNSNNIEQKRAYSRKYYNDHKEEYAQYREQNRQICRQRVHDSYIKNKEARLEYSRNYYQKNKIELTKKHKEYDELHPEIRKNAIIKYRNKNPELLNFICAKRRAARKQATPAWANIEKIREFYILAKKLTKETGIKHVVDHIIPLQSKIVCGLHVENNLQILTESENCKKSNKFPFK